MKKFPKSSMIRWYDYDPKSEQLFVCFNDGKEGYYEGVPYKVFTEMNLMAVSKGKFLSKEVKGRFKWNPTSERKK